MGLAKDLGHLTDDITILREFDTGLLDDNNQPIMKWQCTNSKGLYRDITKVVFNKTQEQVSATGYFLIQENVEIRDGAEERIVLGKYEGTLDTLPDYAREIYTKKDNRRIFEIKLGLPPTEWKVYVK